MGIGRIGQAGISSNTHTKMEKLCVDAKEDRMRYEEVANDPNVEVVEKYYNSTPKGVLWLTIIYNRRGPEPAGRQSTVMDQFAAELENGNE